eukprot:889859-Amphidinium_carterae.1
MLTRLLASALAGSSVLSIAAFFLCVHLSDKRGPAKTYHYDRKSNNFSLGVHLAPYTAPKGPLCDRHYRLLPELYLIGKDLGKQLIY